MSSKTTFLPGNILKVAIVLLASVLLSVALFRFFSNDKFVAALAEIPSKHPVMMLITIFLLPVNWFLETWKWKKLVEVSEPISWKEAWSGVLAGLAIGAATPNRIGEFAGRVFQLRTTTIGDGISFTMIASMMQVCVTSIAGCAGLWYTEPSEILHVPGTYLWLTTVVLLIVTAFVFLKGAAGVFSKYLKALSLIKTRIYVYVFLLSAVRYVVYATQFYFILKMCGISADTSILAGAVAVNYLVVTIIPSFMISELFVRGTVASGIIGSLCGNPEIAAFAAVITWMLNVAVPAVIGFFMLKKINFSFRTQ